jgi:hypothetical protein
MAGRTNALGRLFWRDYRRNLPLIAYLCTGAIDRAGRQFQDAGDSPIEPANLFLTQYKLLLNCFFSAAPNDNKKHQAYQVAANQSNQEAHSVLPYFYRFIRFELALYPPHLRATFQFCVGHNIRVTVSTAHT